MKQIKHYVDKIKDEVCDSKEYAMDYLEAKANNNNVASAKYKEMASDELKHAMYIHDMAVTEINKLKTVYTAPVEMEETWNKEHRSYLEKVAEIKQLLSM